MSTAQLVAFDRLSVAFSPSNSGVYWLFDGGELIYIGKAETSINDRLSRHINGMRAHAQCKRLILLGS